MNTRVEFDDRPLGSRSYVEMEFDRIYNSEDRTCCILTEPGDDGNIVTYATDDFYNFTGYQPEEVVGRDCRFLQGPNTCPDAVNVIRQALIDGTQANVVMLNYKKNGQPVWVDLLIKPIGSPLAKPKRFAAYVNWPADLNRGHEQDAPPPALS
ncbi:MAG: PAS domain-containing protein [Pseudomonadota bacterium]